MFGIKIEEKRPILCFQALQDEGGEWEQKKKEAEKQGNSRRSHTAIQGSPQRFQQSLLNLCMLMRVTVLLQLRKLEEKMMPKSMQ